MTFTPDLAQVIGPAYDVRLTAPAQRVSQRVWRLPAAQGDLAVKCYDRASQAERATREARVLAHLNQHRDSRFRVQALRLTRDGAALLSLSQTELMVTDWDSGDFRAYDRYTRADWAALGESLAALHCSLDSLAWPELETLGARLKHIAVDEIRHGIQHDLQALPGVSSQRDIDRRRVQDYADTCLRMLDRHYPGSVDDFPADDPQRPIHNDYNQFNYLFGPTLPPLILDWEAAIGAPREYEVVRCMNHLPLEAPDLADAFVRAYVRVRPLRPQAIAWAVDAACLQHAIKRWVLTGWLRDPVRYAPHLEGAMHMVSILVNARDDLIEFFIRRTTPMPHIE